MGPCKGHLNLIPLKKQTVVKPTDFSYMSETIVNVKYLIIYLVINFLGVFNTAKGQNYADSLDNQIVEIFKNSGLPGLAVGIVDASGVLFSKGYGFANKKERIRYTPNTTQSIASISKTFIALALMKTIEDGHFTLETPINQLLPFEVNNPHIPQDTIRVRHLVTHTSGIVDGEAYWRRGYYLLESPDFENRSYTEGERDFFQMILRNKRIDDHIFLKDYLTPKGKWFNKDHFKSAKAGTTYEYCNIGAALAAYIVEIAQKKSYSVYIRQTVLEPLHMTHTNWDFEAPRDPKKEAIPYLNNGDQCPRYSFSTYADGAIRSSVFDLQKYLIEMIRGGIGEGKIVSGSSYQTIFDQIRNIDESDGIGVFWFVQKRLNDRFHQGSGAGITTVISFNPEDQLGVVILCNHETDNEAQSAAYVAIWKALIKHRRLLAKK